MIEVILQLTDCLLTLMLSALMGLVCIHSVGLFCAILTLFSSSSLHYLLMYCKCSVLFAHVNIKLNSLICFMLYVQQA